MSATDKLANALQRRKGLSAGVLVDRSTLKIGHGSATGPLIARLKQELRSARAEIKTLTANLAGARERAAQAEAELRRRDAELDAEHRRSAGTSWRVLRLTLKRISEFARVGGSRYRTDVVSIKSLARAIQVCPRTVQKWIRRSRRPDPDQVAKVAAWLRSVDLSAFFGDS